VVTAGLLWVVACRRRGLGKAILGVGAREARANEEEAFSFRGATEQGRSVVGLREPCACVAPWRAGVISLAVSPLGADCAVTEGRERRSWSKGRPRFHVNI
jgi:hypothetical protein